MKKFCKINGNLYLLFLIFLQNNVGQANGKPRLDLNVEKAWVLGITGKNITTAIMDDGVDYLHPDLANNFVGFQFSRSNRFQKRPKFIATCFVREKDNLSLQVKWIQKEPKFID